jgi:hypothetical protein
VPTVFVLTELAVVVLDFAAFAISILAAAPGLSVFGALALRTLGGLSRGGWWLIFAASS